MRYGRYLAGLLCLELRSCFRYSRKRQRKRPFTTVLMFLQFRMDVHLQPAQETGIMVWYARNDSTTVYTQIPSSPERSGSGRTYLYRETVWKIPVRYSESGPPVGTAYS